MLYEVALCAFVLAFGLVFYFRVSNAEIRLRAYYAERENELHMELRKLRDDYTSLVASIASQAHAIQASSATKSKRVAVPPQAHQNGEAHRGRRPGVMIPEEQ